MYHDVNNLNICVDNTQIIIIDENLTWKNHIDTICKKVSSGIGALKRVRRFVNRPYLIYCCPVWDGIGSELSSKFQKLQDRAARMITESTYENSSNSLLEELNWHQLSINRKNLKAILMQYKTINKRVYQNIYKTYLLRDLVLTD
jgi:hypothetical protein